MLDTNVLAESSARWMQAGLEAFTRQVDARDFAVHHCAVAVEHLLEAYLAALHPALVVEGRDLDSLLYATGHGRHATVPVTRIKTIGLADALTRVERLLRPQIAISNRERSQVLAARNEVAHGGLHDPTEVEAVLATCVRVADSLLVILGKPTQQTTGPTIVISATAWRRSTRTACGFDPKASWLTRDTHLNVASTAWRLPRKKPALLT